MIRVAIGGKSKAFLNHPTKDPPKSTDEKYELWEQDDLVIFSWLIQNIESAIASNLTEFPTAKMLWDALTVTYSSGKDKLQTFDLHGDIERRDPNPMTCPTDIAAYNKIRSENKLFQFLNALDRKYDPIKREILRWDHLPTAEAAYTAVRKETAHQNILGVTSEIESTGQTKSLTITNEKGRLSKEEIEKMIKAAQKYKLEDQEYQKKVNAYNALEDCLYNMRNKIKDYKVNKKVHTESLQKMQNVIAETTEWLENNQHAPIEELQRKKYAEKTGFTIRKSTQEKLKSGIPARKYLLCNKEGLRKGTMSEETSENQIRTGSIIRTGCLARAKFKINVTHTG
nr:putative Gag-polypeptide of LTR copia-type [Tanacetum cinerariifolium]